MTGFYSSIWVNRFGLDPTQEWAMAITGLNSEDIIRVFKKMGEKHPTFPPNPFEFRAMALPDMSEYELPEIDEAYRIAKILWHDGKTSYLDEHPCFYHMKVKRWFFVHGFRHATNKEVNGKYFREFTAAMQQCVEHVQLGRSWAECPALIEQKENPPVSKEEGISKCKNLIKELDL